jgi:fermentation-respiration switch protein FrsA (DUF1100 family)
VAAAVDVLVTRGASDPARIGAFGFSVGAAILSDVAARDQRFRAVVLAACVARWDEQARYESGSWGVVTTLPIKWVDDYHTGGAGPVDPATSVAQIGPRPLLLIAGDMDTVIPWANSPKLYALAKEPKELWIVPGAGHGYFASVAPEAYPRRLVAFFDRNLQRAHAASNDGR